MAQIRPKVGVNVVGETVIQIKSWRDYVQEAQRSLTQAQARDVTQVQAISHLYHAVVEITQALKKLETRDDD